MHRSFLLSEPLELVSPFPTFQLRHDLVMSRGSTDSLNSPAHRHSMSRTPSRDHRTTDNHQSTPRPRVRSNSTPDKRLSTSSHTAATSIDHHKNQDRKTWSAGPASPVVRGAPSPVQRSPSTAARNQSQTNLQLHRSVSNSPSTPTNRQRTSSTLSTHTAPTISRRYSRSSQHLPTRQRPILFYHKHEPHYGFTNFSNHGVKYAEKVYPTSEHLFQSLKVCFIFPQAFTPSHPTDPVRSPPVTGRTHPDM